MAAGAAGMAGTRRPWDFGRFLSTATKFNSPADAIARAFRGPTSALRLGRRDVVWSPAQPNGFEFGELDDVVMGGCSQSSVSVGADGLTWSGEVTTANNGGFTGVRSKTLARPLDLSQCAGIKLRATCATGFRYKCILRDSIDWNGIAWTSSFTMPKGGEKTVALPFASFVPTLFARTVPDSPPLRTDRILAVQLSLSKFEYDGGLNPTFREGRFNLTLRDIETY
jgi:hypothetical protein